MSSSFDATSSAHIYTLSLHDALPIYYPSECHADYFDFERIEALKPAIEACGISTLSQSPMLGFNSRFKSLDTDRKSGSAGMPRPSSYAVFRLKKKKPRKLVRSFLFLA